MQKLANKNKIIVEELQKTSLGKMHNIFAENMDHDMEYRDVIIFLNDDFELFIGY